MEKSNNNLSPLVTIITVSYNAVNEIEKTILSVLSQSYHNIEYIVVDGGSTDGTIDIIKKYSDKIDIWISEPDNGVYDAMNKGVKIAHGEWVNFMNCGDLFASNTIVEYLMKYVDTQNCDVLYGDVILKTTKGLEKKKTLNIKYMRYLLPFCHQSSFVKLSILKITPFNLFYKFAADYDFFHKLYFNTESVFFYVDKDISVYESANGISSVNRQKVYNEICTINGRKYGICGRLRFYMVSLLLYFNVLK